MTIGYHDGHRRLQDEFESRKIADRLDEFARTAFSEDDKTFIESCAFFLLATADAEGRPDCSHKGGMPGFARVSAPDEIVFPDYDGNGMFKSLGNIAVNPNVGLLFINFEKPRRLRVTGTASFSRNDPLLQHTVGAQLIVRVKARRDLSELPAVYPNNAIRRTVQICAAAGRCISGTRLEEFSGFRADRASPANDVHRLI